MKSDLFWPSRLLRVREASVKPWPLRRYAKLLPRMICGNYKAFLILKNIWYLIWRVKSNALKIKFPRIFTQSSCYFAHVRTYVTCCCVALFFFFLFSSILTEPKKIFTQSERDVSRPVRYDLQRHGRRKSYSANANHSKMRGNVYNAVTNCESFVWNCGWDGRDKNNGRSSFV